MGILSMRLGLGAGRDRISTVSPSFKRRAGSSQSSPLSSTRRPSTSLRTCDQLWPGSHCRNRAASVCWACSAATVKDWEEVIIIRKNRTYCFAVTTRAGRNQNQMLSEFTGPTSAVGRIGRAGLRLFLLLILSRGHIAAVVVID